MKFKTMRTKISASILFVAAALFFLTFSPEAQAGSVGIHIGIGIPFYSGHVVSPPVVYPPPRVIIVSPPHTNYRPFVPPHYGYYRPYVSPRVEYYSPKFSPPRYHVWKDKKYLGHVNDRKRHK